jgi:nucleoside-diphosphate-sugar epimerase
MLKRALITGGAGFIGFALSKSLSEQGYDVTILDNFSRGSEDEEFKGLIEKDNVHFIKTDLTKHDCMDQIEGEFDYVYHLAMINGTENFYNIPDKVLKVGILGTLNVLDWFVKQKKGKFLFSSSSETYAGALKLLGDKFPIPTPEDVPLVVGDPSNVRWSYGASKILSEVAIHSYAKAYGMKNFSIIRYHNIYGPRMGFEHVIPQFIERIVKKESPFKIFGGQETRTFCYIDDGVEATQIVMESKEANGKTIHIGRDDGEIKIMDLAKELMEVAGEEVEFDVRPAPEGCVMRRCPDISKLKSLGYESKVSLEEGLKKCYDWYKDKF